MSIAFEGKKDYTTEVQSALPESLIIAKNQSLEDAISFLLPLEKQCRIHNDYINLKEVSIQLIRLCYQCIDWNRLNSILTLINKRSAQHKSTFIGVVTEAMTYIEHTPTLEIKIALMKTLIEICDGKLFVEGESAHLHFQLADIYEHQLQDISSACDSIQDIHVETYGSLSKEEKAKYILEQIRLNLLKKDYIRAAIHSRKMNIKTIEEIGFESIKLLFYQMQIEYYLYEKNIWEISQAYFKIANTRLGTHFTFAQRATAMEYCIFYTLASKQTPAQVELLQQLKVLCFQSTTNEDWKDLPIQSAFTYALKLFLKDELIVTPFVGQEIVEQIPIQQATLMKNVMPDDVLIVYLQNEFHIAIIEYNLRMIAKYYTRIRITRLSSLLSLSEEILESHLSELSFRGDLMIKMDRPKGIVSFQSKKSSEQILSDWTKNISNLLELMETTGHLINRENMVYKI